MYPPHMRNFLSLHFIEINTIKDRWTINYLEQYLKVSQWGPQPSMNILTFILYHTDHCVKMAEGSAWKVFISTLPLLNSYWSAGIAERSLVRLILHNCKRTTCTRCGSRHSEEDHKDGNINSTPPPTKRKKNHRNLF